MLERSGAIDLANEAARVLATTSDALPALSRRSASIDGDALDRLESSALALADAAESVPADDWAGAPIEALTRGIDQAAALLRQAERAVDAALAA